MYRIPRKNIVYSPLDIPLHYCGQARFLNESIRGSIMPTGTHDLYNAISHLITAFIVEVGNRG